MPATTSALVVAGIPAAAGGEQHLAHGGRGDSDAETLELADDPPVAPVGILTRESKDQRAQRPLERRPPGLLVRIRPASRDKLAMPTQHRLWLHREARPSRSRKRSTQRREERPVNWAWLRPTRLPTQDRQLVPQDQDLQLLRAT